MKQWWKKKVVYQIYPRSFQDSNGDGIGDLRGIIQRLDYLAYLGVELLWLSPVYASPNDDNGYDISDYYEIMPEFGTMEDMDTLISEAQKRNIGIIMDLVANHTSDEHEWFQDILKNKEHSPYFDYYVWEKGDKNTPPNELQSIFGGSAWEYCDAVGQYYLHIFSKKQPDLNWKNATMRQSIYQVIEYWLKKGIAGFRLDVIDLIGKIPEQLILANGPMLHPYIREMTKQTFAKYDAFTVGETWNATLDDARLYSNPDGSELSMVFQFQHVVLGQEVGKSKWDKRLWTFQELKDIFIYWQKGLAHTGWNSLFLNNHDLPRAVSFFGNTVSETYREKSAKMLATMLHGLQGTPFIYQGEEIGMTNVTFSDIAEYRDIETLNMYHEKVAKGNNPHDILTDIYRVGRDNARTPMQWDSGEYGGFSTALPWLGVNSNYHELNVEKNLADQDSIFYYYQKLIALRKKFDILTDGIFDVVPFSDEALFFCYERRLNEQKILVFVNGSDQEYPLTFSDDLATGEVLIHNYQQEGKKIEKKMMISPYEAFIILLSS